MKRRAVVTIMVALALFGIAATIRSGWLYLVASAMAGLVVVGLMFGRRPERHVTVQRSTTPEVFEGDNIQVRLKVTNNSRLTRSMVTVRDLQFEDARGGTFAERASRSLALMQNRWETARKAPYGESKPERKRPYTVTFERIGPEEAIEVDYEIEARRRGVFAGSEVSVRTGDAFGSISRERVVGVASETTVLPRVYRLDSFTFKPEFSALPAELMEWSRKGTGQDYYGVREYVAGDSLRHIHWRSSARRGKLIVKEYQHEFRPPSGLLVVLGAPRYGDSDRNTLEDGLRAAASVADYYTLMGSLPGLVIPSGEWFEVVQGLSLYELFRALAAYEPAPSGAAGPGCDYLAEAVAFTMSELAPGRVTGIITNADGEVLAEALDRVPEMAGGALVLAPEESYRVGPGWQPPAQLLADLELASAGYRLDTYLLTPDREIGDCLSEPLITTAG